MVAFGGDAAVIDLHAIQVGDFDAALRSVDRLGEGQRYALGRLRQLLVIVRRGGNQLETELLLTVIILDNDHRIGDSVLHRRRKSQGGKTGKWYKKSERAHMAGIMAYEKDTRKAAGSADRAFTYY